MRVRQRDRSDNNAKALDERARAYGVSVLCIDRPFDRLWGYLGITALVEYKNPKTPYGRKGLNAAQAKTAATWRGLLYTVSDVDEVEAVVGLMRNLSRRIRAA